jgi:hypothetical protein
LQDAGYTPQFISSEQIERGELSRMKALVLCNSLALSDKECRAIDEFAKTMDSRNLLGRGNDGLFDEHGSPKPRSWFRSWLFGIIEGDHVAWATAVNPIDGKIRFLCDDLRDWLQQCGNAGAKRPDSLLSSVKELVQLSVEVPGELAVRTHRYHLGSARLLAFERNVVWQMGEDLKQHGANAAFERPVSFEAKLSAPAHVYDLRSEQYLGHLDRIAVELDPWHPSLFALLDREIESGQSVIGWLSEKAK